MAEVRFTAYYPDWPNAKNAAKVSGFGPKETWRTLKVCRPKTKGCTWEGDEQAATVTYRWDPTGGEKKRSEMFQLAVASPKVAILDEIDSGLDIDAVREVATMVETLRSPSLGVLIITHYSRILRYMNPDRVHVMVDGRVVESGGPEIAERLESEGYAAVR